MSITEKVISTKSVSNQANAPTSLPGGSTSTAFKDSIVSKYDVSQNIYNFNSDKEYGVFENYSDAVTKLPSSLFYEAQSSEDGRSGLFNHYIIGDFRLAKDATKLNYIRSERFESNQMLTLDVARNPTAQAIIKETTLGGAYLNPKSKYVSQPYNVKDFIFCKNYGIIPNNRMITLRRFPTPVMDNMRVPVPGPRLQATDKGNGIVAENVHSDGISKEQMIKTGAALPMAQAVTFFGEGTGNNLNEILGIDTGLKFSPLTQEQRVNARGNDPGLINTNLFKYIEQIIGTTVGDNLRGISNLVGGFTDPNNIDIQTRRVLFDKLTAPGGPLSQRIFVDVNTVDQMYIRKQGFVGGLSEFSLNFKYNLTSVGEINSRMLFIDLMANLLAIGSDYGKFLAPQMLLDPSKKGIGFPGGANAYIKSMLDPVGFINDMMKIGFFDEIKKNLITLKGDLTRARSELTGLASGKPLSKDSQIFKTIGTMMTSALLKELYFEPMMLSGYPTGEWHVVVGNPLNPIAMMGNLICTGVSVKFNNVLGPDDFPTEMEAIYKLRPARQRHRGDFESFMNRGAGRLYLGKYQIADQTRTAFVGSITGMDYQTLSNVKNIGAIAGEAVSTAFSNVQQ